MSAAEIIELIKKLPPEGKAEVVAFARSQAATDAEAGARRYISTAEFEKVAPKVFADNHDLLRRLAQ